MAIVINGTVVVDESSGTQNADNTTGDASGNDVAFGNLPLAFEEALSDLGLNTGAATTNVAVSGGSDSDPTGTAMITGLPAGFTDIAWSDVDGIALNGADSGLDTTDGTDVLLYTYSDNNVLLGRAGGASGDIVFAAYLEEVNGTDAKVWLVQFESMFNPLANDPDDPVNPDDVIYVAVAQNIEFSLTGAPSGQNLFMMFGDGTPNVNDVTIVVTGENPINQSSDPSGITSGDTVNTGKGGGDTTLGTNSQQIVEGTALYFTFVKGASTDFTVPNLDQNEADVESNIAFTSLFGASSASFSMAQITSGDQATVQISAYTTPFFSGVNFIDHLHDNTLVEIDSVTVTTQATKDKGQTVPGETLVFDKVDTDPHTQSGVTVTFAADGTVTVKGLDDKDEIEYHTAALHTRVLIDNIGSTDTNFDAPFDIGSFAVTSPVVEPFLFNAVEFQDAAPSLAFGNLVGTGTALTQTGFWSIDPGADGLDTSLGNNGLDLDLNWFSLDGGTTQLTNFTFQSDGTDLDGNFLFSGTLTGDFDNDAGTADTDIDFTFEADLDGHYELTIAGGFGSEVTIDTADGALKAGGPDAVQTLVVPKPPADPVAEIVFFSAGATANTATIQSDLDLNEAQLEAAHPSYIDFARAMNVSTSGIGVANNLLEGNGTTAGLGGITAADESFVVNPDILVSSVEIFVDNSVGGYAFSATGAKHEELYYRVYFDDGSVGDLTLVDEDLGLANKGQATSFVVDGGDKEIDAVQLTMNIGDLKVPHIVFSVETTSLASDILIDFSAALQDGDGDPATSDFSTALYTNQLSGDFDFVLAGTASAPDAFNVDLASDLNTYQVTGFDASTDLRDVIVLLGDPTATVESIVLINGDADSLVTIDEAGEDTTVEVVGVTDLTAADIVLG